MLLLMLCPFASAAKPGADAEALYRAADDLLTKQLDLQIGHNARHDHWQPDPEVCARIWGSLEKAAAAGHTKAMQALEGLRYDDETCGKRDTVKAREWLRKAAELGDDAAELKMAQALEREGGRAEDIRDWYEKAAKHGNTAAKQVLFDKKPAAGGALETEYKAAMKKIDAFFQGELHRVALGEDVDETTWPSNPLVAANIPAIQKAAEGGIVAAQYDLGTMYESGSYLPKDLKLAAEWYRKAAAQNHPKAERALQQLAAEPKP